MPPVKYSFEFIQYSATIRIPSNCNVITFINNGTIDCKINTMPLLAGQTLELAGNENEIDTTEYNIDLGSATNGSIWVIKKVNKF